MEDGEYVVREVKLSKKWKGGKAGLEHLANLVHVHNLLLHGVEFNDESLARVRELTDLQTIRLYATGVTDEGEEITSQGISRCHDRPPPRRDAGGAGFQPIHGAVRSKTSWPMVPPRSPELKWVT